MWKNSSPKDPRKIWYSKSTNRCSCEKQSCFTTSNFDSLPRAENLLFQYEIFVTWSLWCWSHVWKFSRPKDTHKNSYSISTNVVVKQLCFSQLHMLVDLEYHFFCGSFGLEFFHMCKQHKDVPTPKIPCEKKNSSILGRVSKLAAVKHFLQLPLVSKSWISFFVSIF